MNNNYLENIKHKVEEGKVKQVSARAIFFKNLLLWGYVLAAVVFSSVALGRIFFLLDTSDMPIWQHLYSSFADFLLNTFPYVWSLLSIIFIYLAADRYRKTEFGYRYTRRFVIAISVALSVIFGFVLYALGMGQLAQYLEITRPRNVEWQSPQEGRIVGVASNISTSTLNLTDKNGQTWTIFYEKPRGEKLLIASSTLRVIGFVNSSTNTNEFVACMFVPADGRPLSREVRDRFAGQDFDKDDYDTATKTELLEKCHKILEQGRAQIKPEDCCRPKNPSAV
jgi:hypothetical protein